MLHGKTQDFNCVKRTRTRGETGKEPEKRKYMCHDDRRRCVKNPLTQ